MKHCNRILLFFYIGMSWACSTTNKQVSDTQSVDESPVPKVSIKASYNTYTSAMGKGKGIVFNFEVMDADSIHEQLVVDSIILGGKALPFRVTKHRPLVIESNYYKLNPEPSVDTPKPIKPVDTLIDLHQFYPAQLFVSRNHISYPITIDTIIFKMP